MKKLIAVVLTVAMMLTVCAFTVSADAAPQLIVEGPAYTQVGDTYTVNVRLNDADNEVGGFQGELVYTGAEVVDFQVNPEVLKFNNTEDADTVMKDDGDSVNFATVTDLDGTNPATRIWFKVTFKVLAEGANFSFANVVFSDKNATELTGTTCEALAPVVQDATGTVVEIGKTGVLAQTVPNNQGIVVEANIAEVTDDVTEYGVIFYPTSLLNGAELTYDTAGAVVASVKKGDAKFASFAEAGKFSAVLHFNFSTDENAAKFMGTKVSARVFYKTADGVAYSVNNRKDDKYVKSGVSSKAALNTVLDFAAGVETNKSSVSPEAFATAKAGLNTSNDNWYNNRITVLTYAVENAKAQ